MSNIGLVNLAFGSKLASGVPGFLFGLGKGPGLLAGSRGAALGCVFGGPSGVRAPIRIAGCDPLWTWAGIWRASPGSQSARLSAITNVASSSSNMLIARLAWGSFGHCWALGATPRPPIRIARCEHKGCQQHLSAGWPWTRATTMNGGSQMSAVWALGWGVGVW